MPVVIRELHVKVNVEEEKEAPPRRSDTRSGQVDHDTLIDACVDKIVEIMKDKDRR